MKFLAVLIVIFIYRTWQGENPVRSVFAFERYQNWFADRGLPRFWRYGLCVGLPTFAILFIDMKMHGIFYALLWLALSLVILVYALDIYDAEVLFDEQTNWLRSVSAEDQLADVVQRQEEFEVTQVYDLFQSIAPALFWFLIFGPAGALFYAFTLHYLDGLDDDDSEIDVVENILYWLEWFPARVTGLLFAVVGNFGPTIDYWMVKAWDTEESNAVHLVTLAGIAVDAPATSTTSTDDVQGFAAYSQQHVQGLRILCDRAVYGWLGVAAIIVIIGW